MDMPLKLLTDNSSAMATIMKRGPGRMKHLDIKRLWLQEELRRGRLLIGRVSTEDMVADIFTKPLAAARLLAL
eukprot:15005193-Heterocapsa_arctica.AAC.1